MASLEPTEYGARSGPCTGKGIRLFRAENDPDVMYIPGGPRLTQWIHSPVGWGIAIVKTKSRCWFCERRPPRIAQCATCLAVRGGPQGKVPPLLTWQLCFSCFGSRGSTYRFVGKTSSAAKKKMSENHCSMEKSSKLKNTTINSRKKVVQES